MRFANFDNIAETARRLFATMVLSFAIAGLIPVPSFAQTAAGTAQPTASQTDMVLDWNDIAVNSIVGIAQQRPERGMIRLAMVHLAIYDVLNAIAGYPFTPYTGKIDVVLPASADAAAATAAHDVLVALFPDQQTQLDSKYEASLATIPDGAEKSNGISAGRHSASAILAARAGDGRDAVVPYTPGSGPGVWVPTPPNFPAAAGPEVARVQPWTLKSPSQFRVKPPPDLTSERWARDYNEVKALGAATSSSRTPEQTDIGRFWSENTLAQWDRAWRRISMAKGLSMNDNARFFAVLAAAVSDAMIACWDSKYTYNFWRPVTAIRAGDTDGNPDTQPDTTWTPLVTTPPHPEYPSAHGCFTGATTETLKFLFDTDDVSFSVDSTVAGLSNPVHNYSSFSQALDEVSGARIYGGMHYRNSMRYGAKIGKKASHYATDHFFLKSKQDGNR